MPKKDSAEVATLTPLLLFRVFGSAKRIRRVDTIRKMVLECVVSIINTTK